MTRRIVFVAAAVMAAGAPMNSGLADILIGVAAPLTGQLAPYGEQLQRAAEVAVGDINAAGGVLGQRVVWEIEDDACDPQQAVPVARKLVGDSVVFVLGHICSGASISASTVYGDANVVQISPASTNPKLTDQGLRNVFRVVGRDDQQGVVAGDYLADHFSDKPIAIIHDQDAYGRGLAAATKKRLNERGVNEALYLEYVSGEPDYSDLIRQLREAKIEVVYLGGYGSDAGLIRRLASDDGYDFQLVSGDAMTSGDYALVAGAAGEGTLFTFAPDPRRIPEGAEVVERFRASGFEPEGYTLHSYAAIQAWAQAVEQAGSVEPDKVIAALLDGEFDTVLGHIGFDEKGDVTTPGFVWYVWKDGSYTPVE